MEKLEYNYDFGNKIQSKIDGNFFEYSFGNKEETLDKLELIKLAQNKAAKVIGINATGHSNKVIQINALNLHDKTRLLTAGIDGILVTNVDKIKNKIALVLGVADCGAISVVSPSGDKIALLHAGHKGTSEDIIGNLFEKLEKLDENLKEYKVYIAPMAGENFEYEEELYFRNFQKLCDKYGFESGKYFQATNNGKGNLYLKSLIFDILNSKIKKENIIISKIDTNSAENNWPSYREAQTTRRILVSLEN